LIFQWEFPLAFHTCIYCILIRLTSCVIYSFSIVQLPCYLTAFSAFHYTTFIHRHIYFNIIHFLSLTFLLLPPFRQNHYYNHVLSLIHIYMYMGCWEECVLCNSWMKHCRCLLNPFGL
jgi:hypothetical protein